MKNNVGFPAGCIHVGNKDWSAALRVSDVVPTSEARLMNVETLDCRFAHAGDTGIVSGLISKKKKIKLSTA